MTPEQAKVYTLFGKAYAACRTLEQALAYLEADEAPPDMARAMNRVMVHMDDLQRRLMEHDGGKRHDHQAHG